MRSLLLVALVLILVGVSSPRSAVDRPPAAQGWSVVLSRGSKAAVAGRSEAAVARDPGSAAPLTGPAVAAGGGLTVRVPNGWQLIRRRLTNVISPVQRLVVTSWPLPPRPKVDTCDPLSAVGGMPPRGAFLFAWEYTGATQLSRRDYARFGARPARWRLGPHSFGRDVRGPRTATVLFHDRGRAFQVQLYLGPAAGLDTVHRLLFVLGSLDVTGPGPGPRR